MHHGKQQNSFFFGGRPNLEIITAVGPLTHMVMCFALAKFGGGVVQLSGSIGGNTYARNRYGNYVRPRTKPTNPKTERQGQARAIMQQLTDYWSTSALTDAQRAAWGTYAAAVPVKNRLGESTYLSGFNMFIRSNAARMACGGDILVAAPTTLTMPGADPTIAVSADAGTQLLTVAFDATQDWAKEDGGFLEIAMGQPQNASRNYFGGPYRTAGALIGDTGSPLTSPQTLSAPYTLVSGQLVWVWARIVRADGRVSNQFFAPVVTIGSLLPSYGFAGTLAPDSTGTYDLHGAFNGKAYYTLSTGGYHLWWDGTSKWIVSVVLGTPGTAHWDLTSPTITGTYTHQGTATGDGTLS